jgi:hypothetical protein
MTNPFGSVKEICLVLARAIVAGQPLPAQTATALQISLSDAHAFRSGSAMTVFGHSAVVTFASGVESGDVFFMAGCR